MTLFRFRNARARDLRVLVLAAGLAALLAASAGAQSPQAPKTEFKFSFAAGQVGPGAVQVTPEMLYTKASGYGCEQGYPNPGKPGAPFIYSVALPEGNYAVTVTLGDPAAPATTTVKAEQRRLMLENVAAAAGQSVTRAFTVSVRRPEIAGGSRIRLKARELTYPNWDEKLTLEFSGSHPAVRALTIVPAPEAPTLFIVGDSTVTDQDKEPWNSWGQMLTRFFDHNIAVANYAESGESLASFIGEKRWDKVMSVIRKGDWVMIQMGHNDMKDRRPDALARYKKNLKRMVAEARQHGATPVLVTSMERKNGVTRDTLEGYPSAVIEVAKEEKTALIDLHAMSKKLYAALGADLGQAFQDGTHHNNYGSYELAKCIVQGIRESKLDLAKYIADDFKGFDPAHPDPLAQFAIPASPARSEVKPEGN